uniref:Putative rhamnose-binding lectin-like protein n=1 Tax=Panstrongylus lignarius TaxID=156445 RepID=A0A224XD11_9HEMI
MSISNLLVLMVFLQTVSTEETIRVIACTHDKRLNLVCPKGHTINILTAMYGATDEKVCHKVPNNLTFVANCVAKNSFSIVKDKCNLRQRCAFETFSFVFGEPCGDYKYLEVTYQCLRNFNIMTSVTCQYYKFHLECPRGEVIKIVNAMYGQLNSLFCSLDSRDITSNKCVSYKTELLEERCNNLNSCTMRVNEKYLGNPCIGVFKYLEADYMCVNRELHPLRKIVCQNETMFLSCPKGQVIRILTAVFGKKDSRYCNQPGAYVTNCEAGGTLDYAKYMCDFRQNCTLNNMVNKFGDPCLGIWKYLDVTYECKHDGEVNNVVVCEYDKLTIDCGSKYIWITAAFYGRKDHTTCYNKRFQIHVNHCEAAKSYETVYFRCQNQNKCTLDASNNIFGDPCISTSKYLDVDYMCKSYIYDGNLQYGRD